LQSDWERAYAEQLPRVYSYLRSLVATAQEAEQHTTRVFELAWHVRKHYRRDLAAFESRVLALAHEVGQAAAHSTAGFTSPRAPSAAFAARLRTHLQTVERAEQRRARLRLQGTLAALCCAALCGLAVAPLRDSAQLLLQQAPWGTLWSSTAATLHASNHSSNHLSNQTGGALAPAFESNLPEEEERWPQQVRRTSLWSGSGTQPPGAQVDVIKAQRALAAPVGALMSPAQAGPAGRVRFAGSKLGRLLLSRQLAGLPMAPSEALFKRFCAGELDTVATSRPIPRAEVAQCASAGIEFIELPLAYAGVAVLVNHANVWADPLSITTLLAVLGDSQTAPAKHWSQLSPYWPDAAVSVYSWREVGGLHEYFDELLAEKSPNLMSDDLLRDDRGARREISGLFEAVRDDPHAIAVLPIGAYLERATRLPSSIKVARVFGWFDTLVRPDPETIASRYYVPLSRVVLLYVNASSAKRPAVAQFVTQVLELGAELASEPIFLALDPTEHQRALQKFRVMQRGSAFPAGAIDGLTVREILQGRPYPRPD